MRGIYQTLEEHMRGIYQWEMGRGERYLSSSTVDYVDVPAVIVDVVVAVDVDVDVVIVIDVDVAVDVVDVVVVDVDVAVDIVGERGEGRRDGAEEGRGGGVGSGMDPAWVVGSGMERGVGEGVVGPAW